MVICAPIAPRFTMNPHNAHPAPTPSLDPEALASLFEHHRPTLRLVAASEVGFDLADDALQSATITALRASTTYTPNTNFPAWASTIVRNAARNLRRSESRHTKRLRNAAPTRNSAHNTAATPNTGLKPSTTPARPDIHLPTEFDDRLRSALDELTPEQRCCLLLKTVLNHDYATIATILDIPEPTARSHARRARLKLLDLLQSPDTNTP